MPVAMPPLAEMVLPPSFLTPRSQRYRIAVHSFVDQTGRAGALTDVAGEVLATSLHARDRFDDLRDDAKRGLSRQRNRIRRRARR